MARDMQTGKKMSNAGSFSSRESQRITFPSMPPAKVNRTSHKLAGRGFTLIEMMIVMAIIMILVGIAAGMYQRSVHRAREATLRSDLTVMRQAIDHYTLDKEAAPQSLEDLVNPQSQYLREIPTDPVTGSKDWHVDVGDTVMSPDQSTTGIVDVHSNSDKVSPFDGTPYNTW
jgi:general secretion pathway protein G